MGLKEDNKKLQDRFSMLDTERSIYNTLAQDIYLYCKPFAGELDTRTTARGEQKHKSVNDTTAMQARQNLTNFMKARIFPANVPWLRFEPPGIRAFDADVRMDAIARADEISMKVLDAYDESNFYAEATTGADDLMLIGNAGTTVEERVPRQRGGGDTFGGLSFQTKPLQDCFWQTDKDGDAWIVFIRQRFPATDAFDFFDGQPGPAVRKRMDNNPMEIVEYLWCIFRNENNKPGGIKVDTELPWASVWLSNEDEFDNQRVREGGFNENPAVIERWQPVPGEEWGRGLGFIARPDAAGLSAGRGQILIAVGRELNPRIVLEHNSLLQVEAGQSGTVVMREPQKFAPFYLNSGTNFPAANEIFRQDRDQIRQTFLADIIEEPETQPRSALESSLRTSRGLQRAAMLAEVIEKYIGKLIDRTVRIMHRAGALPEIDEIAEITGQPVIVPRLVSPFFSAQKQAVMESLLLFGQTMIELSRSAQRPEMLDRIDWDRYTGKLAELSDIPKEVFLTDEKLGQVRVARAKEAAQRRIAEQLGQQRQALPEGPPPAFGPNTAEGAA